MSTVTHPSDPAYFLFEQGIADPSRRSTPTIYRRGCYICDDAEYALMGLPLCFACSKCAGHVPADDSVCSDCGHDQEDDRPEQTPEERARIMAESEAFIAKITRGTAHK